MAEFQDVVRQIKRMCKSHAACCHGCPAKEKSGLCTLVHDDEFIPEDWEEIKATEIELVVMHWAAKHPEPRYPSWNEAWKQLFPTSARLYAPCPAYFLEEPLCDGVCASKKCDNCKKGPIPSDIAEKLGIKPIGGKDDA